MSIGTQLPEVAAKVGEWSWLAIGWATSHPAAAGLLAFALCVAVVALASWEAAEHRRLQDSLRWAFEQQAAPAPEGLVQAVLHFARMRGCEVPVAKAAAELQRGEGALRVCHVLTLVQLIEKEGDSHAAQ
ncbi:hypothetical protein ACVNIS_24745 (plasmid) [Sphaerotilaceae bacterium SBD11-9]